MGLILDSTDNNSNGNTATGIGGLKLDLGSDEPYNNYVNNILPKLNQQDKITSYAAEAEKANQTADKANHPVLNFIYDVAKGVDQAIVGGATSVARLVNRAITTPWVLSEDVDNAARKRVFGAQGIQVNQAQPAQNWVNEKLNNVDKYLSNLGGAPTPTSETVKNIGNASLYAVPIFGNALMAGNATDVIVDSHNGGQLLGGLAEVALNKVLAGEGSAILDSGGKQIAQNIFDKMGLKYFSKALDSGVSSTVRTGVIKTAEEVAAQTAAQTTKEAIQVTVKNGVKQAIITPQGAKILGYALLKDGAYATGYQIANDIENSEKITLQKSATAFGIGVGGGLLFRGIVAGGSKIAEGFNPRTQIEKSLNELNRAQAPAEVFDSIQNAYQTDLRQRNLAKGAKILSNLISERTDLISAEGPIQAAERMGVTVNMVSERPKDSNGNFVNALYKVVDGDHQIYVWDQSPNSIHHEIGHAIWDSMDELLGKQKSLYVKQYVAGEVNQIMEHSDETYSEKFAGAIKQMMKYPEMQDKYPKLKAVIESTYGKVINIPDSSLEERAVRFANLKSKMESQGLDQTKINEVDQMFQSGSSIDDIEHKVITDYKLDYQTKNGEIPDGLLASESGGKVLQELQVAESGKRYFSEDIDPETGKPKIMGIKSSFPKWIPEDLKSKSLLDKTLGYILENKVPKSGQVRELYDVIHNEIRSREGLDYLNTSKAAQLESKFHAPTDQTSEINVDEIFGGSSDIASVVKNSDTKLQIEDLLKTNKFQEAYDLAKKEGFTIDAQGNVTGGNTTSTPPFSNEAKPNQPKFAPAKETSVSKPKFAPVKEGTPVKLNENNEIITSSVGTKKGKYKGPNYKSKTTTNESVQQSLDEISKTEEFQNILKQKRGAPLTETDMIAGARKLIDAGKITKDDLLKAGARPATTPEGIIASKMIISDEMLRLQRVKESISIESDPAKLAKYQEDYNQGLKDFGQMYATVQGLKTEAGRTLKATGVKVDAAEYEKFSEQQQMEFAKDLEKIDPEAAAAMNDNEDLKNTISGKAFDAYFAFWYPSILSGPATDIRIGVDNLATVAPEGFVKWAVGSILHPQDSIPKLIDFIAGIPKGFREAGDVATGKIAPQHESRFFTGKMKKIGDKLSIFGKVMDMVDRATTGGYNNMYRGDVMRDWERQGIKYDQSDLDREVNNEFLRIIKLNKTEGTLGEAVQLIKNGQNSKNSAVRFFSTVISPFAKVGANVANMQLDYLPLFSQVRFIKRLRAGEYANKDAVYQAVGKMALGMGITLSLGKKIFDADPNDKSKIFITGAGPTSTSERTIWQQEGARPYSMKIGNYWVPYLYLGPLAGVLASVGSYSDAKYFGKKDASQVDNIVNGMFGFVKAELSQSFMSGTKNLLDAFNNSSTMSDYVSGFLGSLIPVPALLKQGTGLYESSQGKNFARKPKGFLQNFAYRSGLYDTVGFNWVAKKVLGDTDYKLDVYGQKIQKDSVYGISWVRDKNDPVLKELLQQNKTIPTPQKINGVDLTGEQNVTYLSYYGTAIHDVLGSLFEDTMYKSAPADQRQKQIDSILTTIRSAIDQKIQTIYPELQDQKSKAQKSYESRTQSRFNRQTRLFGKPLASESIDNVSQ